MGRGSVFCGLGRNGHERRARGVLGNRGKFHWAWIVQAGKSGNLGTVQVAFAERSQGKQVQGRIVAREDVSIGYFGLLDWT